MTKHLTQAFKVEDITIRPYRSHIMEFSDSDDVPFHFFSVWKGIHHMGNFVVAVHNITCEVMHQAFLEFFEQQDEHSFGDPTIAIMIGEGSAWQRKQPTTN
jgi:hypothetical protein